MNTEKFWLYGKHSCIAALQNTKRTLHKIILSEKNWQALAPIINKRNISKKIIPNSEANKYISAILKEKQTHQGIIAQASPLAEEKLTKNTPFLQNKMSLVIALDKICDPHNIGAIIRSAVAFNIDAIIVTNGTPKMNSTIAKTSSGAIERITILHANNLQNAIKLLKAHQYWCYGLSSTGTNNIHFTEFSKKSLILIGSESDGLRKINQNNCDFLITIPISNIDSLNASNAACIAMYEANKQIISKI